MVRRARGWFAAALALLWVVTSGCSALVSDAKVTPPPAQARHCQGSEMNTSTHIAMLPVPLVAFFVPRITANAPDSAKYLAKCGGQQQVNREVTVNYGPCVPTIFLTTLITLGIAGVCPTVVSYQADVIP